MIRLFFKSIFIMSLSVLVAQAAELQPGRDYNILKTPQATETGNKIEVIEFFYYGCPHCYDLEPTLNAWVSRLPVDVAFRRIPAIFRGDWTPAARAFYTFDAMKLLDRFHKPFFDAIQKEGLTPDEANIISWAAQNGIDQNKFKETYNSFAVQTKTVRAKQLIKAYEIDGVPSIVVDGRYVTSNSMAGSEGLIPIVEQIVAKARQQRQAKK